MNENKKNTGGKWLKLLIVGAGIVLGQAILYGPSLIGEKVLLPLDLLARPGFYIPPTPETAKIVPYINVRVSHRHTVNAELKDSQRSCNVSLPFCPPESHKLPFSAIAVYPSNRAVHP
jgi:hypothetical protein